MRRAAQPLDAEQRQRARLDAVARCRRAPLPAARKHEAIAAEAALDGIYIIRTSVQAPRMDAADCVRNYKALANVERAFRSLKTVDLKVRPIHHRSADLVRAHILLCMLAYYVEWHMREAWRELTFAASSRRPMARGPRTAPFAAAFVVQMRLDLR